MKLLEFVEIIEGIKLNKNDKDVKKVSDSEWHIFHEERKYVFQAIKMFDFYNIYWYLESSKGEQYIELPKELKNNKSMIPLFNKIITALYQFLKLKRPDSFTFSSNKKLDKIYSLMLSMLNYEDIFTEYLNRKSFEQNNKVYVYFSRKNDIIDERKLNEITNILNRKIN
jgi:hypothetical protein